MFIWTFALCVNLITRGRLPRSVTKFASSSVSSVYHMYCTDVRETVRGNLQGFQHKTQHPRKPLHHVHNPDVQSIIFWFISHNSLKLERSFAVGSNTCGFTNVSCDVFVMYFVVCLNMLKLGHTVPGLHHTVSHPSESIILVEP